MPAHPKGRALRLLLGAGALLAAGAVLVQPARRAHASSADAATLTLLPYTLADSDLPTNWILYDTRASTNAALAFGADDPAGALAALEQQRRVSGLQQTFVGAHTAAPPVRLVVQLFVEPAAATAALHALSAGSDATSVPDFSAPDDLPDALALHRVLGGDAPTDSYTLAWCNDAVLVGVTATGAHVNTDVLLAIARAAAAKAADPPASTVDAAGDTADLSTAQAFDALQLPAQDAPGGFVRGGAYVWSDAQLALDSRAPSDAARQTIASWGRQSGEAEFFEQDDGTRTTLTTGYAQFAGAEGAAQALHDLSLYSASRQAALPLDAGVQLGDEIVALRTVVLWPGGELRDGYVLQWRRGAVVLSVTVVEPANSPAPPYLNVVATALDAIYAAAQDAAA